MKTRTKMILGGVVLAVAVAAFAPQQLKAVASTPVQVMNNLGQWIPTGNVYEPGRSPIQANFDVTSLLSGSLLSGSVYTVPPNKRLIVQQFSTSCSTGAAGYYAMAQLVTDTAGMNSSTYFAPVTIPSTAPFLLQRNAIFSGAAHSYADPGTQVYVSFTGDLSHGGTECIGTVFGHLIDLVAPIVE